MGWVEKRAARWAMGRAARMQSWAEKGGEGLVEVGDAVGNLRGDGVGRWEGGVVVGGEVRG